MIISEDEQTVSASAVTDVLCCLLRLLPTVSLNTNKNKQLPRTNPSSGKRAIHNRVRFQPTSHYPRSRFYVTGEQSPDARRSHVQPTVSPHGHEQESIPLCQLSSHILAIHSPSNQVREPAKRMNSGRSTATFV